MVWNMLKIRTEMSNHFEIVSTRLPHITLVVIGAFLPSPLRNRTVVYGYIHSDGGLLRSFDLDYGDSFSEGMASVRQQNKCFYIDASGCQVGPTFERECGRFKSGVALCFQDGHHVVIDQHFSVVANVGQFDHVWLSGQERILAVCRARDGKCGYASLDGKMLTDYVFDEAHGFYDSRASVRNGRKWAAIALEGTGIRHLTEYLYDSISIFREGFAKAEMNGVSRFVCRSGEPCAESYCNAQLFVNGIAPVCKMES